MCPQIIICYTAIDIEGILCFHLITKQTGRHGILVLVISVTCPNHDGFAYEIS